MTDRSSRDRASTEDNAPLFSLVSGEGDGFMLGIAAGDTAGGAWKLGYSSVTEQATIISYHLIEHGSIDPERLVDDFRELDGTQGAEPVFRAVSPEFRAWLDNAAAGRPPPAVVPTAENLVRASPVGAAFRRDADSVVERAILVSRMFTVDAASVIAGVIGASAVAAAAFGQSGRDLVAGVSEAVVGVADEIGAEAAGAARIDSLEQELLDSVERVGVGTAEEAEEVLGGLQGDPLKVAIAGLLLAAPMAEPPHRAIGEAAKLGGSVLGGFVGAVVGARVGIRAWPWPFANDTWFAEIGRRVVRGPGEVRDLPIPYAVEHHLISGTPDGFH
jgi:hypothetical protein